MLLLGHLVDALLFSRASLGDARLRSLASTPPPALLGRARESRCGRWPSALHSHHCGTRGCSSRQDKAFHQPWLTCKVQRTGPVVESNGSRWCAKTRQVLWMHCCRCPRPAACWRLQRCWLDKTGQLLLTAKLGAAAHVRLLAHVVWTLLKELRFERASSERLSFIRWAARLRPTSHDSFVRLGRAGECKLWIELDDERSCNNCVPFLLL